MRGVNCLAIALFMTAGAALAKEAPVEPEDLWLVPGEEEPRGKGFEDPALDALSAPRRQFDLDTFLGGDQPTSEELGRLEAQLALEERLNEYMEARLRRQELEARLAEASAGGGAFSSTAPDIFVTRIAGSGEDRVARFVHRDQVIHRQAGEEVVAGIRVVRITRDHVDINHHGEVVRLGLSSTAAIREARDNRGEGGDSRGRQGQRTPNRRSGN